MPDDFADEAEAMIRELAELHGRCAARLSLAGQRRRNAAILPLRDRGYSLSQIAEVFGLTRERVRELEKKQRA